MLYDQYSYLVRFWQVNKMYWPTSPLALYLLGMSFPIGKTKILFDLQEHRNRHNSPEKHIPWWIGFICCIFIFNSYAILFIVRCTLIPGAIELCYSKYTNMISCASSTICMESIIVRSSCIERTEAVCKLAGASYSYDGGWFTLGYISIASERKTQRSPGLYYPKWIPNHHWCTELEYRSGAY